MHDAIRGFAAAACLGIASCSMHSSHSDPSPPPPPPPGPSDNPPWQIAPSADLALWLCHVHQDWVSDPTHFGFWWDVRSTFSATVANVDWRIDRLDGTPQPPMTGTIASIPPGNPGVDGHENNAQWTEQQPGARHYYRLTVNASKAPAEAGYANNSYVFIVDVPATSTTNLAGNLVYDGQEPHVHTMYENNQYIFHFLAQNRTGSTIPITKWRLQDPLEGIDSSYDFPALDPNGVGEDLQILQLSTPGLHTVTQTIDAAQQVPETNRALNTHIFYILVNYPSGYG